MKAFVTGSTGLLGYHLVTQLLQKGYQVKALARSTEKAQQQFGNLPIEVIKGDMLKIDNFASALQECDVVLHLAAYFREYMSSREATETLDKVNVEGTLALIEAARTNGVKNFIFVSSGGVLPPDGSPVYNEATDNLYFKSKIKAEKAISTYLNQHADMRIVTLRPSMMIGPNDEAPTPAGAFILRFLNKKIPVVLPGNMVFIDPRDVADAMIEAIDQGESGAYYSLGGHTISFASLLKVMSDASGMPVPSHRPPYPVAYAMLSIIGPLARMAGHPLPIGPSDVKRMQITQAPDASAAIADLGLELRPATTSITDAVQWFQEQTSRIPEAVHS